MAGESNLNTPVVFSLFLMEVCSTGQPALVRRHPQMREIPGMTLLSNLVFPWQGLELPLTCREVYDLKLAISPAKSDAKFFCKTSKVAHFLDPS